MRNLQVQVICNDGENIIRRFFFMLHLFFVSLQIKFKSKMTFVCLHTSNTMDLKKSKMNCNWCMAAENLWIAASNSYVLFCRT